MRKARIVRAGIAAPLVGAGMLGLDPVPARAQGSGSGNPTNQAPQVVEVSP